jgi:phosphatidylethanolamine-binding protein
MRTPHLSISSKLVSTNNSYIILAVDLNVLRNATVHTTLLHWFATGLVVPACSDPGRQKNPAHAGSVPVQPGPTTLDIPGAYYLGPNPPPGTGSHRYVFWLFKQPPNLVVPIEYCLINPPKISPPNSGRLGFDITNFVQATGLGYPIAANYFQITAVPALVPQNPPNTYCNGQLAAC